jgi:predicted CXXCH cytochrome family protein
MRFKLNRLALIPAVAVFLAGCDDKIIYRDRPLYEEVPSAALSFVGYSNSETQLTVCGNCHVEKQKGWAATGHASAWETLQGNSEAETSCEGCHTVGQYGNVVNAVAGYEATGEERYYDVQCEACHGPGVDPNVALSHVDNPLDSNVPLAPLNVGAGATLTGGCGECHNGEHYGFVDEWAQSRHGDASARKSYRDRDGCSACHGGEGALVAWGVDTEYLEKGGTDNQIGITCAVCHDPHNGTNEHQLRWPVDNRDVDTNLCMKCHQRRAVPDLDRPSRGPHSPQGPLLLGQDVGWIPPNFAYDTIYAEGGAIRGTHGSEANQELCATCHLNSYEVTDPATGDHVFNVTGHLFKPIPCVDAEGVPTGDDDCAMTTSARSFASCTTSGCHGSEDAALSALSVAKTRIVNLVAQLDALLDQVDPAAFNNNDGILTVAEGANFNAGLGDISSSAVHNPFLMEALLTGSIKAVLDTYGPFPAPVAPDLLVPVLWQNSRGGN